MFGPETIDHKLVPEFTLLPIKVTGVNGQNSIFFNPVTDTGVGNKAEVTLVMSKAEQPPKVTVHLYL